MARPKPEARLPNLSARGDAFIAQSDGATCDKCIQNDLGLAQNNQVQQITAALATTSEFVREQAGCSRCGKKKMVTRSA